MAQKLLQKHPLASTVLVTGIVVSGTWLGASWGVEEETNKTRRVILQASPSEKLQQLEMQKSKFLGRREALQVKLEKIMERDETRGGNGKPE